MVDADVLFAGSASPSDRSASTVVLKLSDLTLIDGVASGQVVAEAEKNLTEKVPAAVPRFQELAAACLRVVPGPHVRRGHGARWPGRREGPAHPRRRRPRGVRRPGHVQRAGLPPRPPGRRGHDAGRARPACAEARRARGPRRVTGSVWTPVYPLLQTSSASGRTPVKLDGTEWGAHPTRHNGPYVTGHTACLDLWQRLRLE